MEFYSRYYGEYAYFRVKDLNLDVLGTIRFKRELIAAAAFNEEVKNFILQFQDVTFNDLTSFSALMFARRYTLGKGGRVVLVTPKPKVTNLIKLAKLEYAFDIIETEEAFETMLQGLKETYGEPEDVDPLLGEYSGSEALKAPKKFDFEDDFKFIE
ncbi:MAG TPA: anti-sigma factor antagonist [Candidatus Marinimicrobia bacterium]|nr:anti-sigma factor antagonist [Candidatus Neomarinimicrobiota bacterium]